MIDPRAWEVIKIIAIAGIFFFLARFAAIVFLILGAEQ